MKVSTKFLAYGAALAVVAVSLLCLYAQEVQPGVADQEATAKANNPSATTPPSAVEKAAGEKPNRTPATSTTAPQEATGKPGDPDASKPPQTKTTAREALQQDSPRRMDVTGTAEAFQQVKLYSRITGHVEKVHVDIGDNVKKGQLLVELDAPELVADLKQKQAVVEQSRAGVELAKASRKAIQAAQNASRTQVDQAQANVQVARATLTFRKAELDRAQQLRQKNAGLITQQMLDEVQLTVLSATAALAAGEANLAAAKANVEETAARQAKTKADLALAEARLQAAMADLQRVAAQLALAQVRTPIDGVVIHRHVTAGDFVQGGDGKARVLLEIARTDPMRIVAQIAELGVSRIQVGTPATVTMAALPNRKYEGKVARLGGVIDPQTGTLRIEIDLPNPDRRIMPGMFARVSLRPAKK